MHHHSLVNISKKLSHNCNLHPSSVKSHWYDQSPLAVKGECTVPVQIHDQVIYATFIVVDVSTLYPLFERDWMYLLWVDVSRLIQSTTQIHNMNSVLIPSPPEQLFAEFSDVFQDQLGMLQGTKALVSVVPHATPKFHRPRAVPFAIKVKLEETLKAQVEEGELIPVEQSEWAAPIVVAHKRDGATCVWRF